MFRVGIIGAGAIVGDHLKAVDAHPETQLCAVADLAIDRAKAAAEPYGAVAYTDYIEMLDQEKPDLAIINLPHALHESCAVACAKRGIHALLEKPMSVSYESCQRINEAFENSGALLQIGHVQRYLKPNRKAREILDSGIYGKLLMVSTIRTTHYFNESRPRWFFRKELAGGGIWINYGAHCLDKLCWFTDSSVDSIVGQCTYECPEADVDGSVQALVRTQNGVTCTITLCGYKPTGLDETILYLTKGSLRIRGSLLWISEDGKDVPVDVSDCPAPFEAQWSDFIQGIQNGKILCCDGKYAADIMRHIETLWK